ncbi:MAG: DUF6106 family protein [Clostridia bacterium]|nr:DUF6106 family protein [Clostridia bacterium]
MDTFFEQIVPIKKTAKDYFCLIGIWILSLFLSYVAFAFLARLLIFAITVSGLIFYGAYQLSKKLFIEYEYIVTNTSLDIDKITAKSSRKRVMSIEIPEVESIEKYDSNKKLPSGAQKTVFGCNKTDKNAYCLLAVKNGKEKQVLVFAPDDRIKEGILKTLPRFIANSAFK